MLILSRKKQQQIYISDNIVVTVVEIKKGVVRLGIDAPKHVSVLRDNCKTQEITNAPCE